MQPRIAIIGGGIGGLTAAIALRQRGFDAQVYEQAPALEEVGAGVGLWPNALRALGSLGLAGKVIGLGGDLRGSGIKRPDGTWLLYQPQDLMRKRWGAGFTAVHRAELQQLLAAQLDPAALHLGACCAGFADNGTDVTVRFAGGREVAADVLIGADGVHSVVRAALLGPAPLRYRGYTGVRSLTPAGSVPLPRDGIETWGRGCRFGVAPASGDRIIWYAAWNSPEAADDGGTARAFLRRRFAAWHDPVAAVIEATPEAAIIRTYVYDRLPARTWARGRVALLGDAIHPMTPDLGQGACQAIVDATVLAACLAQARDVPAALAAYQQRRWRNAAVTTVLARVFGGIGQWEGRLACLARNSMLRATPLAVQFRQLDAVIGRAASPAG